MDLEQVGKELGLSVEDAGSLNPLSSAPLLPRTPAERAHLSVDITRHLSVQVEHHVDLLHLPKDGVKNAVALHPDATVRVGCHAPRVRLDAYDSTGVRFPNHSRGESRGEVERGKEVDGGSKCLEFGEVGERLGGSGDGRDEVGLRKSFV